MLMKRTAVLSAILLLGALAVSAEPASARRFSNPLFNDVVQMTRAGLSDATIVAYVKARRARLEADVNADDLIRLRQAGVSESVVGYIAGVEGMNVPPRASGGDVAYDSSDSSGSAETSYGEDEAYSYASVYPYPYWYGWFGYGYPYWYAYSPFFSGRVFITGRFGGRRFDHRGFRRGNSSAPRGGSGFRGGSGRGSGGRGRR